MRMDILNLVLPVFLVILCGTAFRHFHIFTKETATILIRFALYTAIPALMFGTMAKEPLKTLWNVPFILSFGGGSLLAFLLGFFISKYIWRDQTPTAALLALTGSMSNAGFVAMPLLLSFFGNAAVVPTAIALMFVVVVLYPLCISLITFSAHKKTQESGIVFDVFKQILANPMVLSTLLGVIYALTGLPLPSVADNFLSIMSTALTPCALFAIGLEIDFHTFKEQEKKIILLSIIKIILLPLFVFYLSRQCGLSPMLTICAVIASGVPTAKTVYVLAEDYTDARETVAATTSATTAFSVITLLLLFVGLGHFWPHLGLY